MLFTDFLLKKKNYDSWFFMIFIFVCRYAPDVFCALCLGILQFTYCDNKEISVKKGSANDMAVAISELVKREGYQIDSFSLEVSVPPIILESERAISLV